MIMEGFLLQLLLFVGSPPPPRPFLFLFPVEEENHV